MEYRLKPVRARARDYARVNRARVRAEAGKRLKEEARLSGKR